MKCGHFLLLGFATLAFVGCGSSGETPTASISGGDSQATTPAAAAAKVPAPDVVVASFLESLRNGNDTIAASLLTDTARQETQKKGLKVQPPGTPDMSYVIGQTEFVTEAGDGAHVGSIWSEKLETGEVASFEVIWVLRLESPGWRIVGMATPVGDDNEPLFLNFEDPDDLLRKWQESETEFVENEPQPEISPQGGAAANTAQEGAFNPLR